MRTAAWAASTPGPLECGRWCSMAWAMTTTMAMARVMAKAIAKTIAIAKVMALAMTFATNIRLFYCNNMSLE